MIKIETVDELIAAGYSVSTFCHACKRIGPELDLLKYSRAGRGHLPPRELKIRHRECGTVLSLTIHAAKGYGK